MTSKKPPNVYKKTEKLTERGNPVVRLLRLKCSVVSPKIHLIRSLGFDHRQRATTTNENVICTQCDPEKNNQMSLKVAQKWFHKKNEWLWHIYKNCLRDLDKLIVSKGFKKFLKSKKSLNLVTLFAPNMKNSKDPSFTGISVDRIACLPICRLAKKCVLFHNKVNPIWRNHLAFDQHTIFQFTLVTLSVNTKFV